MADVPLKELTDEVIERVVYDPDLLQDFLQALEDSATVVAKQAREFGAGGPTTRAWERIVKHLAGCLQKINEEIRQ